MQLTGNKAEDSDAEGTGGEDNLQPDQAIAAAV